MSSFWTHGRCDRSGSDWQVLRPCAELFQHCNLPKVLSQINRWGGHTSRPYSVAEHSLLVAALVPRELVLAALVHDAAEAVTGDVVRPWLEMLARTSAAFSAAHTLWHDAANEAFGVQLLPGDRGCLRIADDTAMYIEARTLVARDISFGSCVSAYDPLSHPFPPKVPALETMDVDWVNGGGWEELYGTALARASQGDESPLAGYFALWARRQRLAELNAWVEFLQPIHQQARGR